MTDDMEPPVDLSPLRDDAAGRVARIVAGVGSRVSAARAEDARRLALREDVRRRLARFALPVSLAAAASLAGVLVAAPGSAGTPETFAIVVLGRGPATHWIVLDRQPEVPELIAVVGSSP